MTNTENPQDLYAEIERLKGELANAQQNYTNLFENIGDSLFIIDLSTYTIIITNEHATRRFGYTSNEIIGMSLDDIEVIDTDPDSQELVWESSFSGTRVYECHYRHRDGSHIPVEVSSRIITRNGREVIQNFVRNIKIRKQM
ncbi:MAG TPA: PAS domain S-box protein, partial [Aggregatilineales bacterium]|nr:PAS domain S-box protein [Aggregatilineales bacterium]